MLSCTLRYREGQALTGESSDVLNMEQKPEAAFMEVVHQPLKNQPSIGRKRKTSGCIKDLWTCEHSLKLLPTPEVVFTFFRLLGHTLVWIVHLCLWLFIGIDVLSWIKLNLRRLSSLIWSGKMMLNARWISSSIQQLWLLSQWICQDVIDY